MSQQSWALATGGDPKFWPAWIRYSVLANICVFVFMGNMFSSGISTGFIELSQDLHVSFAKLGELISWSVLALGLANLFWMPTGLCVGKRPAILASMVIFLVGSIWATQAKSFDELMAARIVGSLGAGSVESLGPSIIADIFFERYFATAMALFSFSLAGGTQIGPMIAGFLIQSNGWRWFFILCSIIIAINLVTSLFFLPETTFRRAATDSETAAEADKHAVILVEHAIEHQEYSPTNTASGDLEQTRVATSYWRDLIQFKGRAQEPKGLAAWPRQFMLPFRFMLIPSALYGTCLFGMMLSGIVVISTLSTQLLSPPPYLFTSSDIGLYTLSAFIGVVLACPLAGPATDMLSKAMAYRNGGIHKPEHRMPALIFPFIISPPGLILFAYMIDQHKSYYLSAVGYCMQVTGVVFVPSVVLSSVVDAYPRSGGEALVLINAGKNVIAFGVTLSCNDWLAKEGLVKVFCELALAQWGLLLLGIPLYFAGPWLRKATLRALG